MAETVPPSPLVPSKHMPASTEEDTDLFRLDGYQESMGKTLKPILLGRLARRRSSLMELRFQLNGYASKSLASEYQKVLKNYALAHPPHVHADTDRSDAKHWWRVYENLDRAEAMLDTVEVYLKEDTTPEPRLEKCRAELEEVNRILDNLFQTLGNHTKTWERILMIWALSLLCLAAGAGYVLWIHPSLLSWHFLSASQRWPQIRLLLLCACGGLAGTAVDLSQILYRVIPARSLDPRRILWYFSAPFFSAALAAVAFLFLHAGAGFSAVSAGGVTNGSSVAEIFSLGFLIGFVPSAIVYRINGVVKAFFGTDEVRSPQITPPQVVRTAQTRLFVSARVTPSGATRIVSATARVQTLSGAQGSGGNASVALQRGLENTWSGELDIPALEVAAVGLATGVADPATPTNDGTITVEAQDETGNVSRSETVSLPPFSSRLPPQGRVQSVKEKQP